MIFCLAGARVSPCTVEPVGDRWKYSCWKKQPRCSFYRTSTAALFGRWPQRVRRSVFSSSSSFSSSITSSLSLSIEELLLRECQPFIIVFHCIWARINTIPALSTNQNWWTEYHNHVNNIRNINFQSQTNVHLLPRPLAPSVLHLLETTTATMSMRWKTSLKVAAHPPPRNLPKTNHQRLYSLATAAVVVVMPTRLVFKTRSLGPDSGSWCTHHFVRQRAVALKVSLKALKVA